MRDLEAARAKTLWLLDKVPDEFLKVRVHSFYSPIGWHFGHIGRTEEYWISHKAFGRPVSDSHLSFLFADLPDNPKDNRVNLPSREEIKKYLLDTRRATLHDLESCELCGSAYFDEGYAWDFALQHECQHQETICEMLQLIQKQRALTGYLPVATGIGDLNGTRNWGVAQPTEFVGIPADKFNMGSCAACVYDNEKQLHEVSVEGFALGRTQVTANQWLDFMRDGGYERRDLWSSAGWAWGEAEGATAPEYWLLVDGDYFYIGAQGLRAMDPQEAVSSIGWYEAEAYLKWAGMRFPTEEEWEYAASFNPNASQCSQFPWGEEEPTREIANHGISNSGPQAVGRTSGESAFGIRDMAGNVWEWTSSKFFPYPGFEAFPYDGYSKDHMKGEHYVCRGGSWATAAPILRCTFRNWYVPTYRQGFLGLRAAR
ncbi:MAG TPA: SUMF1/EgtB/PvdO family nonheme iron enzyme [Fimbriimonadaceae bacterium]